jgi:hypothetical protein
VVSLFPVKANNYETSDDIPCVGRYTLEQILGATFTRLPEDLETDPSHLIMSEEAIDAALEACGSSCAYPPPAWGDDREPTLVIYYGVVAWRIMLSCPSHCPMFPDWLCRYQVDANTGEVLAGGEECCVDC